MTKQGNPMNISVADLQTLANLIEVVSSRGAIHPQEMETVGAIYGKLKHFISAVPQDTKEQPAEQLKETE